MGLYLARGFLHFSRFFQRPHLRFGQYLAILRHLGFQRFESFGKIFQIVSQPDRPHATGGNQDTFLLQLVAHTHPAKGRLFDGNIHHRLFDMRLHAVLLDGFAPADLLQSLFAARLVKGFDPVETVTAVAHDLASLRYVAQLACQVQNA